MTAALPLYPENPSITEPVGLGSTMTGQQPDAQAATKWDSDLNYESWEWIGWGIGAGCTLAAPASRLTHT